MDLANNGSVPYVSREAQRDPASIQRVSDGTPYERTIVRAAGIAALGVGANVHVGDGDREPKGPHGGIDQRREESQGRRIPFQIRIGRKGQITKAGSGGPLGIVRKDLPLKPS